MPGSGLKRVVRDVGAVHGGDGRRLRRPRRVAVVGDDGDAERALDQEAGMAEEGEPHLAVLELRDLEGGRDDAGLVAGDEARAALGLDLGLGRCGGVPMAAASRERQDTKHHRRLPTRPAPRGALGGYVARPVSDSRVFGEGQKLGQCRPVARGADRAERLLDDRAGELRAADPRRRRVVEVDRLRAGTDQFANGRERGEPGRARLVERRLEEHDEEVARIGLRLGGQRVGGEHRLDLGRRCGPAPRPRRPSRRQGRRRSSLRASARFSLPATKTTLPLWRSVRGSSSPAATWTARSRSIAILRLPPTLMPRISETWIIGASLTPRRRPLSRRRAA